MVANLAPKGASPTPAFVGRRKGSLLLLQPAETLDGCLGGGRLDVAVGQLLQHLDRVRRADLFEGRHPAGRPPPGPPRSRSRPARRLRLSAGSTRRATGW